jgi:hypothetical protein
VWLVVENEIRRDVVFDQARVSWLFRNLVVYVGLVICVEPLSTSYPISADYMVSLYFRLGMTCGNYSDGNGC